MHVDFGAPWTIFGFPLEIWNTDTNFLRAHW
jgi:hypothetical protein